MSNGEPPQFEVRLRSRRVQKELDSLQPSDHRRVLEVLRSLSGEPGPQGSEKLYDDVYRVRVGQWRIIYLIDLVGRRIDVGGIRRRSERTYRRIVDLFG